MKTFFDAPHLNDFNDPIRITRTPRKNYPIRQDLSAIELEIDYVQKAEFFRPAPLGIVCPDDSRARLFNETNPSNLNNGLVSFTRQFCTTPATRYEFENGSFTFPGIKPTSDSAVQLQAQFTRQIVLKVEYSYLYTTDPENDLVIQNQFQITDPNGSQVLFLAGDTSPSSAEYATLKDQGGYIQATETEFTRWRGNVWEMVNKFVLAR